MLICLLLRFYKVQPNHISSFSIGCKLLFPGRLITMLQQPTFENANEDCKRALLSICNWNTCEIADMVKSSQNVDSMTHHTATLAMVLATQLRVSGVEAGGCFNCGLTGYFKKDCPQQEGRKKLPPRDCPRCIGGKHWANECHSCYTVKGEPVQSGNC